MCACVGWSAFPKSCFSLSPIVSLDMCACVGWCFRLPKVLSPLVSHSLLTCVPVLDGASALDGVSAFPRSCLPLSTCVGWCVRLPDVLFPLVSSHVRPCWMVCPPPQGLFSTCPFVLPIVSQVSPIVSLFVSPSPLVSGCAPLFPIVSPHVCLCWMVCSPSEVLSPLVSQHVCLCWMVCPPSRGFVSLVSELVSQLVFLLVSQLVSQLVFLLFPFVAGGLILHFCPNSVRLGILNAFSCHVFDPVPQKHVLNPPTVWGLRWCNLVTASGFVSRNFPLVVLAGGWLSSRIRRTRFAAVSALISQH